MTRAKTTYPWTGRAGVTADSRGGSRKKNCLIAMASLLLTAGAAGPALSGDLLLSDSLRTVAERTSKHPQHMVANLTVPVPVDEAQICVYHSNTTRKGNRGRLTVRVTILREGTDVADVVMLEGAVHDNQVVACAPADSLAQGDLVTFEIDFFRMPRLRKSARRTDTALTSAVIGEVPALEEFLSARHDCPEHAPASGILLASDSIFRATERSEPHPSPLQMSLEVPARVDAPRICVSHSNTAKAANKGAIRALATIRPNGGDAGSVVTLEGAVQEHRVALCGDAPDLESGDVVDIEISFAGMPRLRGSTDHPDWAQTSAAMGQNPTTASLFPDPRFCQGTNAIPSDTVSAADQAAASRLLNATLKTQLWRYKADKPTKWTVTGPKTRIVFGTPLGNIIPETAGYGNTIAAAVGDYERKMGRLQPGPPLTEADVRGLEWFSQIDSKPGPTAVRRSAEGGYYGEYYRQSTGVVVSPPYSSLAPALQFLEDHGL